MSGHWPTVRHASAMTQSPSGDDEASFLGDRKELRRRKHPELRMLPADQRLDADQPLVVICVERLVVELEPASVE